MSARGVGNINEMMRVFELEAPRNFDRLAYAYGGAERCLQCFLLASGGDVSVATGRIVETIAFRALRGIDVMTDEEVGVAFESHTLRCQWPSQFHNAAPDGSVVQVTRLSELQPETLGALDQSDCEQFIVLWLEEALRRQTAAARKGLTCPGVYDVYDCKKFSITSMLTDKVVVRIIKSVVFLGHRHYPETMNRAFFVNAPFMATAVWKLCKSLVNSRTRAKISVSPNVPPDVHAATGVTLE